MGDESNNRAVIELDLETGKFETKINGVPQKFQEINSKGVEALKGIGLEFIEINQAIELGQKALELWHKLLDSALETEKIKNQQAAFKSFAQSLGVDQEALATSIEKASRGTVTHIQAMNSAMDLLQAGVNARDIPALTQLATNIEATGRHGEKFADIIRAISTAAEMGSGRGLRQYDLIVNKVGDRQDVVNAILEQGKNKFEAMGDTVEVTNKKIDARMEESWHKTKMFFGEMASGVAFKMFADDTDKATQQITYLEKQLADLQKRVAAGQGDTMGAGGGTANTAIIETEKQLAALKAQVAVATKSEAAAQSEANDKLKDAKTFALELLPAQKLNAEALANRLAITQKLAEEEKSAEGVTLKTLQDLSAARKAEIEKDFAQKKLAAEAGATDEKVLAQKLVQIEREKYDAIRAIRVSDTRMQQAEERALLNITTNNMRFIEGAQATHQKIMLDTENKRYQVEIEQLRTAGLQGDQFNKQVEQKELQHQQRMKAIRDQYNQVNSQNLKFGINQGLQDMEKQYGSFTAITARATKQTQSIMTKSFVEAAKGHGNAMEMMKQQFLEMIGTEMIQTGTFMMLRGLFPPNPVDIGAGVALVAAGSALVGASGSSAPTGDTSGGGGGGFMTSSINQPNSAQATNQKSAQIIINGDYLNSRETANHLQDIIRSNSDITDFSITAQGKNYG